MINSSANRSLLIREQFTLIFKTGCLQSVFAVYLELLQGSFFPTPPKRKGKVGTPHTPVRGCRGAGPLTTLLFSTFKWPCNLLESALQVANHYGIVYCTN